ncbi:MAG: TonB-dependent receptor [Chloracidobacterium sp.]|nr:TonB-dependent receptor [Chloracidobacterium sp.]
MRRALHALFVVILFGGAAFAQQDRGSITGTVADQTGAAVSHARIEIRAVGTQTVVTTTSNEFGQYSMPNLPIGLYSVKVEANGFKSWRRDGLTLGVSQTLRVDASLEVGATSETVMVTGQATLLQTETPEVGTTINKQQIDQLPLSFAGGRSPETFAYELTPGVQGDSWQSKINGSPFFSKEVLLDGASVTTYLSGHFGETYVSPEALGEFKIQTSGLSAEYGRTGGGVFNFVMRSGENKIHGSAFGQLRNEALNANSFINNALGLPRSKERRFDYGASFGGPVWIPKLYDGHDKTFFYFALERYRERQLVFGAPNRTVPQPEMYDGDLSSLLTSDQIGTDALGRPIYRGAIYDPNTLRQVNGKFVADPFPGNIIPQDRISAVSRRIGDIAKKFYAPVGTALTANNFFPTSTTPEFDQNQWSARVDHNLSAKQKLNGMIARSVRPRLLLDSGGPWSQSDSIGGPLSAARRQVINSWMARVGHDYTISPTLFNNFKISFNRMANPNRSAHVNDGCAAALGITGVLETGECPRINWGGGPNGVSFDAIGDPQDDFQAYNSWGVANTLSWTKGRHFLKFGVDFRGNQENNRPQGNLPGTFNFTAAQTGIPGVNFVGHAFASFLLGDVNSASVGAPLVSGGRIYYYSGFVQDDFKFRRSLTFNLGLRYELQPPPVEVADRTANFNLSLIDPLTGMRGAVEFAGDGQGRTGKRRFVPTDKTDFGPRVGFAWSPNERWAIRGAYGIFYNASVFNGFSGAPFQRGFAATDTINNSLNNTSVFNWDGGYPGNRIEPTFDPTSWRQGGVTEWDPKAGRVPYTQQWNLNIQRELFKNLAVDIGYVGNKSTGIWAVSDVINQNQLDPQYLRFGADLANVRLNTDADAQKYGLAKLPYPAFGESAPGKNDGGLLWQALVPYPQLARNGVGLSVYREPYGHSTYHSLQIVVNQRMSKSLTVYWNYNLSKTLQNIESTLVGGNDSRPLDIYNLRLEKSIADDDRTHNFKTSVIWDLPFGRGQKLFSKNRLVDVLLGGWQLTYIGNYSSGTPLRFTGSGIPGFNGRANRPDLINPNGASLYAGFDSKRFQVANISASGVAAHLYVAPGLIVDHQPFTLGTAAYALNIRDFWGRNEDIGLRKAFRVREGMKAEFRVELLNAFNRHTFGGIDTNVLSPRFGQVTSVSGNRTGQVGLRLDF